MTNRPVPVTDATLSRLVIAARRVAFELETPITDADDLKRLKELDAASEAYADSVPWEDAP